MDCSLRLTSVLSCRWKCVSGSYSWSGRPGQACVPGKVSTIWAWHVPDSVKQVRQFIGFIDDNRQFIQNLAGFSEPLVALTQKGVTFAWTGEQQVAFYTLQACLLQAPILGFPTEEGRFILAMDASLFAVGGILNQLQDDREVVIAYASRSLRLSKRRYCTTQREMLMTIPIYTHFRSYVRGAQLTLRTDHRSVRWLQKFRNSDGMLARWYMLLGQFSVTFE